MHVSTMGDIVFSRGCTHVLYMVQSSQVNCLRENIRARCQCLATVILCECVYIGGSLCVRVCV